MTITGDNPYMLTYTISVLPRFENDEWYLDVTEGFEGQPPIRQRIGPVPFEILSDLAEDVRKTHIEIIKRALEAFKVNRVSDEELAQRLIAAKAMLDERMKDQHKLSDIAPYDSIYPASFVDYGRFKR